ncbi:hypothetical protein Zmor_019787 [Zophobas morio]|uniref:Gustatory receptor n=1 Tax=Zophobas morio TaxID=2755281 RepID=A0AA38I2J8_9CUCU|nr:hypothetical protein Zmor_019787 [Zophobas morio]
MACCASNHDSKTLHIFFTYLNIFLITPWYDFNKNCFYRPRLFKLYGCSLMLAILSLIIFSLMNGSLQEILKYATHTSQKIVYCFVLINLTLLTIITTIKSCFLDHTNWKNLLRNYHYIDKKISKGSSGLFRKLVWRHLIYFMYTPFSLYLWLKMINLPLIQMLPIIPLPYMYYKFMLVMLAKILADKIKSGYVNVNTKLARCSHGPKFLIELRSLTQDYRILGETIEIYNNLFGYQIILIVFHCGLEIVSSLNFVLTSVIVTPEQPFFYQLLTSNLGLFIFSLVSTINLLLTTDATTQEALKFLDICYKLQDQLRMDSKEIEIMTKLICYSRQFFREFSARGYFKINKSIVFSLIGNVATYFIIAVQFNHV